MCLTRSMGRVEGVSCRPRRNCRQPFALELLPVPEVAPSNSLSRLGTCKQQMSCNVRRVIIEYLISNVYYFLSMAPLRYVRACVAAIILPIMDNEFMSLAFDDQALTDKPLGSPSDEQRMRQVERIRVEIHAHPNDANRAVAQEIAGLIRARAAEGKNCVLGLGDRQHAGRRLRRAGAAASRRGAVVRERRHVQSRRILPDAAERAAELRAVHARALVRPGRHRPRNWHVPDGTLPIEQVPDYCRWYEDEIAEAGGIDIQILGIGRTGHIGFNEPGSGATAARG